MRQNQYFSYDLVKNEAGEKKSVSDGFVVIEDNETIVAKFILANKFQITNIRNPKDRFWRTFSLELDFRRTGTDNPAVDGLILTTRDVSTDSSMEFLVPWGNDHDVRRR